MRTTTSWSWKGLYRDCHTQCEWPPCASAGRRACQRAARKPPGHRLIAGRTQATCRACTHAHAQRSAAPAHQIHDRPAEVAVVPEAHAAVVPGGHHHVLPLWVVIDVPHGHRVRAVGPGGAGARAQVDDLDGCARGNRDLKIIRIHHSYRCGGSRGVSRRASSTAKQSKPSRRAMTPQTPWPALEAGGVASAPCSGRVGSSTRPPAGASRRSPPLKAPHPAPSAAENTQEHPRYSAQSFRSGVCGGHAKMDDPWSAWDVRRGRRGGRTRLEGRRWAAENTAVSNN